MNWVDGVCIAVLVVSGLLSFWRGFVREVLSIAAWAGAIIAGFAFRDSVRPFFEGFVDQPWLADGLAVGSVFLAVVVVMTFVVHWIAVRVEDSALGGLDRTLGAVFGIARGAFLVVLAYIVGGMALPHAERWPEPVREARFLPWVVDGARMTVDLLPAEYRPRVAEPPARAAPTQEELMRPRVGSR